MDKSCTTKIFSVSALVALLLLVIYFLGIRILGDNILLGNLDRINDSINSRNTELKGKIALLDSLISKKEEIYRNKVDSITKNYNNKLGYIQKKFDKEKQHIISLSVPGQVEVLKSFITEIDSLPRLVSFNKDTIIQLHPKHVESINLTYLGLQECNESLSICKTAVDSLITSLNDCSDIIMLKNDQIRGYNELVSNQDLVISNLQQVIDKDLALNRKNKMTFLGVGLGIGVITMLLIK